MNRCIRRAAAALAIATAAAPFLLASTAASAQGIVRSVPANVKLAKMTVTAAPEIMLNGAPDRLSPGSRIHDLNNMLVLSGALTNREVPVVYQRDAANLVHEVWLLTDAEYAKLGGVRTTTTAGMAEFIDLLALIFGARR